MPEELPSNPMPSTEKIDFKRILPIVLIVLVDLLGVTIIIPLMPLYATSFNASPLIIGLLGATYPMMQFIGAPILGRLSDRFGRRPILLISQIGTLSGFLLLGFANSLWILFLSRMIDGISGANIATAQAAITDVTTEKNRTQGLGLIGAAFGIGFVIGPVIAFLALAASDNNYHVPAFVAAFFSLLSIILTYFLFVETHPKEKRGQTENKPGFSFTTLLQALSHPAVGLLLMLIFAQQIVFGGFEQLLSLFTLTRLGLNASGNSIIFVFVGVIIVAVQGYFIGRWSRRLGDRRLIFMGLGLLSIGMVMISFTPRIPLPGYNQSALQEELGASRTLGAGENPTTRNVPADLPPDTNNGLKGIIWILIAMVPAAIGGGVLQPTINSLITKRIEPDEIGGMLGISVALLSVANAIAPLVWGAVFQALGPGWPFLLGGIILGILLVLALRLLPPGREQQVAAAAGS